MTTKNDINDDMLLAKTRHVISRHQVISPTPRDTMAVLMQEAEKMTNRQTSSAWNIFSLRWPSAMAALLILGLTSWLILIPADQSQNANTNHAVDTSVTADLGLDTAAWDMEIDALMSDLDSSLVTMVNEGSANGIEIDDAFNNEDPWL